jgi:Ca2+-binding EF-hand superfamily protein
LFDEDRSGYLDIQEVTDLVKFVYGKPLDDNVVKILDTIDEDGSGTITFHEFCKKNRSFPSLLFPAFHMQEVLRMKCMGAAFW